MNWTWAIWTKVTRRPGLSLTKYCLLPLLIVIPVLLYLYGRLYTRSLSFLVCLMNNLKFNGRVLQFTMKGTVCAQFKMCPQICNNDR